MILGCNLLNILQLIMISPPSNAASNKGKTLLVCGSTCSRFLPCPQFFEVAGIAGIKNLQEQGRARQSIDLRLHALPASARPGHSHTHTPVLAVVPGTIPGSTVCM
jgi:hypothetical protein